MTARPLHVEVDKPFRFSSIEGERRDFDESLQEEYTRLGFETAPRTEEEALRREEMHWNGLLLGMRDLVDESSRILIHAQPTRFGWGPAYRSAYASRKVSKDAAPQLMGTGLVGVLRSEGKEGLLLQIKGKTLGSGGLHLAVAGFMDPEDINSYDPIGRTLARETEEEIGLDDLMLFNDMHYGVMDEDNGHVNLMVVPRLMEQYGTGAWEHVLESYASIAAEVPESDREVKGLLFVSFDELEGVGKGKQASFYTPESIRAGGPAGSSSFEFRPLVEGLASYLVDDAERRRSLMERAGL